VFSSEPAPSLSVQRPEPAGCVSVPAGWWLQLGASRVAVGHCRERASPPCAVGRAPPAPGAMAGPRLLGQAGSNWPFSTQRNISVGSPPAVPHGLKPGPGPPSRHPPPPPGPPVAPPPPLVISRRRRRRAGAATLVTVVAAAGTPVAQDTAMVTVLARRRTRPARWWPAAGHAARREALLRAPRQPGRRPPWRTGPRPCLRRSSGRCRRCWPSRPTRRPMARRRSPRSFRPCCAGFPARRGEGSDAPWPALYLARQPPRWACWLAARAAENARGRVPDTTYKAAPAIRRRPATEQPTRRRR
jgi:hypothetical protein